MAPRTSPVRKNRIQPSFGVQIVAGMLAELDFTVKTGFQLLESGLKKHLTVSGLG